MSRSKAVSTCSLGRDRGLQTHRWREVDSNLRSRANALRLDTAFLSLCHDSRSAKGTLPSATGGPFRPLRKEAERRKCCRAGAVLVWNNRETEMANLVEIKALFLALVGGSPGLCHSARVQIAVDFSERGLRRSRAQPRATRCRTRLRHQGWSPRRLRRSDARRAIRQRAPAITPARA
jgi:hypothetical protein